MTFAPIVQAALETQLASLTRLVTAPAAPLYYGRDLSCVLDCTPQFASVEPSSRLGLAQAIVRRLITPRGALVDDPDYGLDLRSYCNRALAEQDLWALQQHAQNECQKDERVDRAQVRVELNVVTRSLTATVRVVPLDPALATFDLVLALTDAQVLLELIGG